MNELRRNKTDFKNKWLFKALLLSNSSKSSIDKLLPNRPHQPFRPGSVQPASYGWLVHCWGVNRRKNRTSDRDCVTCNNRLTRGQADPYMKSLVSIYFVLWIGNFMVILVKIPCYYFSLCFLTLSYFLPNILFYCPYQLPFSVRKLTSLRCILQFPVTLYLSYSFIWILGLPTFCSSN